MDLDCTRKQSATAMMRPTLPIELVERIAAEAMGPDARRLSQGMCVRLSRAMRVTRTLRPPFDLAFPVRPKVATVTLEGPGMLMFEGDVAPEAWRLVDALTLRNFGHFPVAVTMLSSLTALDIDG
jgi:hypothetical protein